jgi:hypothetical protein
VQRAEAVPNERAGRFQEPSTQDFGASRADRQAGVWAASLDIVVELALSRRMTIAFRSLFTTTVGTLFLFSGGRVRTAVDHPTDPSAAAVIVAREASCDEQTEKQFVNDHRSDTPNPTIWFFSTADIFNDVHICIYGNGLGHIQRRPIRNSLDVELPMNCRRDGGGAGRPRLGCNFVDDYPAPVIEE